MSTTEAVEQRGADSCSNERYCREHNHEEAKTNDDHHHHHHKTQAQIQKTRGIRCLCMMVLTAAYMVAEVVVGIVTGSLALLGDGFHMMSDLLSLIVGFISIKMSLRKTTSSFTFGYQRAEIVGGFANAIFLISAVLFIVIDAIQRFIAVEPIENPVLMFSVAAGGLLVNILGLFIFHEHDHGSHENKSVAIRGMFIHVLGDFMGSVAALASGLIITYCKFEGRQYFDPACSLLICILICISAVPLLKETLHIMMQATPAGVDIDKVSLSLCEIDDIKSIHELHVWSLGSGKNIAACHVILTDACTQNFKNGSPETAVAYKKIQEQVMNVFHNCGIHNVSVQIELAEDIEAFKSTNEEAGKTESGGRAVCFFRRNCVHNEKWCCQECMPAEPEEVEP